ncbi:mitogen-activated protein kinase kinase kinase 18-like [Miscanthus floridulus]|uniref:mitogen-activated protein kinase kinase kinase 18-like n=1 Tax=Miscanthus floridulus TaxID=154761 RepID=UPI003458FC50
MATAAVISGRWTRVRTLGRGASGAVVSLAADGASGALFAVKSAPAGTAAAEHLRREGSILSALRSPHIVPCLGVRAAPDGGCQLLLEFAPGGSLADAAARSSGGGGRIGDDERAVAAYAADVARGLAYLHARSLVHGDVKARNVVVGADGRAKLADFGCARAVGSASASARPIIGGTPAFMAPEVARGEEQGPAADVWALGCTVVEMATGRAPWSGVVDSVPAAVHRIGYTDAVPEVPAWMSAEARDFLARCCFARNPRDRCTAAQLLEHPFLASAGAGVKAEEGAAAAAEWRVSPKSTLDAALWESDADDDSDDEGDVSESPAQRIKALACPCSALPDWDSEEGDWIEVLGEQCEAKATNLVPTKDVAGEDECQLLSEVLETEVDFIDADAEGDDPECSVAVGLAAAPSVALQEEQCRGTYSNPTVFLTEACHNIEMSRSFLLQNCPLFALSSVLLLLFILLNDYPFHIGPQKNSRTA